MIEKGSQTDQEPPAPNLQMTWKDSEETMTNSGAMESEEPGTLSINLRRPWKQVIIALGSIFNLRQSQDLSTKCGYVACGVLARDAEWKRLTFHRNAHVWPSREPPRQRLGAKANFSDTCGGSLGILPGLPLPGSLGEGPPNQK